MELLSRMSKDDYEQVVFCQDRASGLQAIIAIHDTTLGPALGGARLWRYDSEPAALEDVLRLAKAMTCKSSLAGLNTGGGKSVILGDRNDPRHDERMRAFGRQIERLNGRYITAEDIGTSEYEMDLIQQETRHVTGKKTEQGGGGNPAPMTAYGVYLGVKATMSRLFGTDSLNRRTVAVQGVGSVGSELCRLLAREGAFVIAADVNADNIKRLPITEQLKIVSPDEILRQPCDVLAPCAMGGVISDQTIPQLRCKAVAGAANNQLAAEVHGRQLQQAGILYAPDYLINAGGLIHVEDELHGYNRQRVLNKIERIYERTQAVFKQAEAEGISTSEAAYRLAEDRLAQARAAKPHFRQMQIE